MMLMLHGDTLGLNGRDSIRGIGRDALAVLMVLLNCAFVPACDGAFQPGSGAGLWQQYAAQRCARCQRGRILGWVSKGSRARRWGLCRAHGLVFFLFVAVSMVGLAEVVYDTDVNRRYSMAALYIALPLTPLMSCSRHGVHCCERFHSFCPAPSPLVNLTCSQGRNQQSKRQMLPSAAISERQHGVTKCWPPADLKGKGGPTIAKFLYQAGRRETTLGDPSGGALGTGCVELCCWRWWWDIRS
jgi:hypothetical protein